MISKTGTYNDLKNAVNVSFTGDKDIFKFYDPNAKVENADQITDDILIKIKGFENAVYKIMYDKNNIVGYFVYHAGILISFALNVKYRTRKYLRNFMEIIKLTLSNPIVCVLWAKNIRAVRWLEKNGFIVRLMKDDTIILNYKK